MSTRSAPQVAPGRLSTAGRPRSVLRRGIRSLLTAVLAFTTLGVVPAGAGTSVDWNDRSTVDIELPSGWRLTACEGDAPFLCMFMPDGTPEGTIMLLDYELPGGTDTSRSAVEASALELQQMTEEDRQFVCGDDYSLEPHELEELVVGGLPGYRFGYTIVDPAGALTEHVIIHLAFDAGRRIIVSTAFSDPDACPGQDPERDELPITAIDDVEPHLDRLVAESILPTDFDRGPLCRPGQVPTAGFHDTTSNAHEHHIDCLAWFDIVNGYSTDTYGTDRPVTRGQLAAVAARLITVAGEPLPEATEDHFADIAGHAHAQPINRLAAAGVIRGTSSTTFGPNRPATRAQATAVLVAAHEFALRQGMYDEGITFDDVTGVHASAISRAATAHLAFGTADGEFQGSRPLRRDQMASLVGRTLNRLGSARYISVPGGPPRGARPRLTYGEVARATLEGRDRPHAPDRRGRERSRSLPADDPSLRGGGPRPAVRTDLHSVQARPRLGRGGPAAGRARRGRPQVRSPRRRGRARRTERPQPRTAQRPHRPTRRESLNQVIT